MKQLKKVKLINFRELRQKKGWLHIKNVVIPTFFSYFFKIKDLFFDGMIYLFVLRLIGFELTFLNLLSAIALYFFIEELKDYFIVLRRIKR